MTDVIQGLGAVASIYDAIVFDQWGVLHQGTVAYPQAVDAIAALSAGTAKLGVLSNSGKRADRNVDRIGAMGFDTTCFDAVMTSGEALWRDVAAGRIPERKFFPVAAKPRDAEAWADGLDITLTQTASEADAILLMGLADGAHLDGWRDPLREWHVRRLPVYCSNPDRQSPRVDGLVVSPGALAFAYRDLGGDVVFYGKPHIAIFRSIEAILGPGRYLMVGDSLEHDIAGARNAGWDSLLIEGGLYADAFAAGDGEAVLADLVQMQGLPHPTFRMKDVRP